MDAYEASVAYLVDTDHGARMDDMVGAMDSLEDLIPSTLEALGSGLSMPLAEASLELQNSFELAMFGFYRNAFAALRFVLELGILGVFLDATDSPESRWYFGAAPTPSFRRMLKELQKINHYDAFDQTFDFGARVADLYDQLGGYIHTRSFSHSSLALNNANFPRFSAEVFERYFSMLVRVVQSVAALTLLKYPIGMQGVPVFSKFGTDGPLGGYLEEGQVAVIASILPPRERDYLQALSDAHPGVSETVRYFLALPDLSEEALEEQVKAIRVRFPMSDAMQRPIHP